MRRHLAIMIALALAGLSFCLSHLPVSAQQNWDTVLARLDAGWGSGQQSRIVLRTVISVPGRRDEARSIELLDDGVSKSVVEFLDGPQRGQKVLAGPNELWFFAPRTRRTLRLTASQRLLGQASVGDVARLRLSQDYRVERAKRAGSDKHILTLKAKSRSASYQRIELLVETASGRPISAEYQAASGRTLKRATFLEVDRVRGGFSRRVTRIEDAIRAGNSTTIRVVSVERVTLPASIWTRRSLELGR